MIPDKSRKEWADLLTGDLNVPLKNFFFQMKVTQTKTLLNNGKIDLESAIDDIYNLCVKFSKAKNMSHDIEAIFGKVDTVDITTEQNDINEVINKSSETKVEVVKETHQIKTPNFKEIANNSEKKPNPVELELERIRKEAIQREKEFEKRQLELRQKIEEEKKAREEAEKRVKLEKRNRILEAEQLAKNRLRVDKEKRAQQEKEAVSKAIEKKKMQTRNKPKKKVKKTFFQRFFNL